MMCIPAVAIGIQEVPVGALGLWRCRIPHWPKALLTHSAGKQYTSTQYLALARSTFHLSLATARSPRIGLRG